MTFTSETVARCLFTSSAIDWPRPSRAGSPVRLVKGITAIESTYLDALGAAAAGAGSRDDQAEYASPIAATTSSVPAIRTERPRKSQRPGGDFAATGAA